MMLKVHRSKFRNRLWRSTWNPPVAYAIFPDPNQEYISRIDNLMHDIVSLQKRRPIAPELALVEEAGRLRSKQNCLKACTEGLAAHPIADGHRKANFGSKRDFMGKLLLCGPTKDVFAHAVLPFKRGGDAGG